MRFVLFLSEILFLSVDADLLTSHCQQQFIFYEQNVNNYNYLRKRREKCFEREVNSLFFKKIETVCLIQLI